MGGRPGFVERSVFRILDTNWDPEADRPKGVTKPSRGQRPRNGLPEVRKLRFRATDGLGSMWGTDGGEACAADVLRFAGCPRHPGAGGIHGSKELYRLLKSQEDVSRTDLEGDFGRVAAYPGRRGTQAPRTLRFCDWRELLEERNFLRPGVLWWAFDWESAAEQAERFRRACRRCPEPRRPTDWTPTADKPCGPVVLVHEIDKAIRRCRTGSWRASGTKGSRRPSSAGASGWVRAPSRLW